VLSVSIGDSCDFGYKAEYDDDEQFVQLDSGDVLVFGGPARLIVHAVTKIHPGTSPAGLVLSKPSDRRTES
jgi:alkylated DNA repair dioxygenase AlkB